MKKLVRRLQQLERQYGPTQPSNRTSRRYSLLALWSTYLKIAEQYDTPIIPYKNGVILIHFPVGSSFGEISGHWIDIQAVQMHRSIKARIAWKRKSEERRILQRASEQGLGLLPEHIKRNWLSDRLHAPMKLSRCMVLFRALRGKAVTLVCLCQCGKLFFRTEAAILKDTDNTCCGCLNKIKHGLSGTKSYQQACYISRKERIPAWSDLMAITAFYNDRPEGHQVDHIIPLKGKLVSGLHVLENLQYLTTKQNQSKKNKFEPMFLTQSEEMR